MPGLVTIDGVTVAQPLFDGLRNGTTDIPTIFQTQVVHSMALPVAFDLRELGMICCVLSNAFCRRRKWRSGQRRTTAASLSRISLAGSLARSRSGHS